MLANHRNQFLASLSSGDDDLLRPHLFPFQVAGSTILHLSGAHIGHVYFPFGGLVSLFAGTSTGECIEAALLGRDSAIGAAAVLDGGAAINRAICQTAGSGVVAKVDALRNLLAESATLSTAFMHYHHAMSSYFNQMILCNSLHPVEARLARWLLQASSLLDSDVIPLTQETLGHILGVRRTTVTLIAGSLQKAGVIEVMRGRIRVLDTEALHQASCECYRVLNHNGLQPAA